MVNVVVASPRVSPLHRKGFMTLGLVILAESVTVSNAVKLWSNHQGIGNDQHFDEGTTRALFASRTNSQVTECFDSDSSETCTSSPQAIPSLPPIARQTLGRLSKSITSLGRRKLDCCTDCKHCADVPCLNTRGGHVEKVAKAASEAAKAVMPYGIPLNGWKVIFQAFLTTLNVICWLVPLRSKKISDNKLALSIANAFSGGVFLSLAFGHLIPECVHGFEGYNEVTPYLLVLAGYLLIFFVEKVAFDAHEIMHEMEHAQDHKNKTTENGDANQTSGTSGRSALILLGALAVHSILEMTALGLADTWGDSAILTLSIALHQPAESIALLVAFLKSGMPKGDIIRFLSVFSAMGPVGVALGMAVNEFAAPIVDSIMVAIVAGTFVYVGATEVIPEEWEEPEHKWKKFFALMGGIVSILLITQYTATLEM